MGGLRAGGIAIVGSARTPGTSHPTDCANLVPAFRVERQSALAWQCSTKRNPALFIGYLKENKAGFTPELKSAVD
ncbi:hypothetical protein [Paraburkholderia dinghuensis]|uniref:Uncharacterized protein n=1 Tax=Paraburkholderia dinghuensis TaxID=2305225 RepID=A0A3N6Q974_9BURK|nr:hypothetical protein [Paraburkholderia dinghuensis]RQH09126.1 hypothetical protein D1Y85_04505 [Paraburkholderia dinghuensis]